MSICSFPFSFQKLTPVAKVWSSSSMRRTRPKEPSRSFQSVSSQSFRSQPSLASTRFGSKKKRKVPQPAKRQPKTTSTSRFRFLFVPILRPFCVPHATCIMGGFKQHTMFTVDATTASGRPVRVLCLVRTTAATRPARFPIPMSYRFARAFQSSLSESESIE